MAGTTIQETIGELRRVLSDYVEATYHISSPALIEQRKELLQRPGIIHQVPYVESTPRYRNGHAFAGITGLPIAALEVFTRLAKAEGDLGPLLYDPPYQHQSEAIAQSLVGRKNLLVMTGTGSGKTESFLLPILGKFAREAKDASRAFAGHSAMRALILYPMNALVNDQLGRLRSLFGDPRVVELFKGWSGRPARFARYTSRTPYAGIRTREKDSGKLKAFDEFYVEILRQAQAAPSDEQREARTLLDQLKARGKWPAKPDLMAWFGEKGAEWQDRKTKAFRRAVTLKDDVELVTRHEVQTAPPDLLVTNYSMLEYMLMRPIERPIFDATRDWLAENPEERFLIVLDEAHLYRGAAGAEVGLLLRRLRDRLGIAPDRFQVICATASFRDKDYAPEFGAQLSGVPAATFVPIKGDFAWRPHAGAGTRRDAEVLAAIDLDGFYAADTEGGRLAAIRPLLDHRHIADSSEVGAALYQALADLPPLGLLVNSTMAQARAVRELGPELFPDAPEHRDRAVTALMALGSAARLDSKTPGLLPCRIHSFFRGLPGLWVCMDPECTELGDGEHSGICGRMYGQPRERCDCGARVLELFTCRFCGTAYARAYTDDVDDPRALWPEPGRRLRMEHGETAELLPLDLLLEAPAPGRQVETADYDLETGRLNPRQIGPRVRTVYLRHDRTSPPADEDGNADKGIGARGQFIPCACCGKVARFGRSTVQDHQTKGDQPFEALVARQLHIQPPGPAKQTRFAPLRGRKVLVFSDSRQVAARLAPNLQMYSTRDSLRPLIAWGFERLQQIAGLRSLLSLDDLYLAVLLAASKLGVRLRPELKAMETFAAEDIMVEASESGATETDIGLQMLAFRFRSETPPQSLLEDIIITVQDPFLGLEALALASLAEREDHTAALERLPSIAGVAEAPKDKVALARAWLRCWRNHGFWLARMPTSWWNRPRSDGVSVKGKKGKGRFEAMEVVLTDRGARKTFNDKWVPELLTRFTADMGGEYQLRGSELSLRFNGEWARCNTCKSVHRPVSGIPHCLDCGSADVAPLDPATDPAFLARKGYYRRPVMAALGQPPEQPMALIAAEHTAQLNAPQNEDVFSKAEENELLFQDVAPALGRQARRATAIDVLSCTTTMEVGIDIGTLAAVALRNMPPGRANYQQRAGRAGRRGNAVATVVAFGSADSHDEHYFIEPEGMIRGDVIDPRLTLDNPEIARRHIRAFLLQNYHQDRLPEIDPDQPHDLFSVLGTVSGFRSEDAVLNLKDFEGWLGTNAAALRARVDAWIPKELSTADRAALLDGMVPDCLTAVGDAIAFAPPPPGADDDDEPEEQPEVGEERPAENPEGGQLLDRLLYRGVLPRYAFPTDVATFHVFDTARSTRFRPIMRFAPSQGLPIALSQYAPGKQIWISGKSYSSGAIYSVMPDERFAAWQSRQLYSECSVCSFARTDKIGTVERGEKRDCPACGAEQSFGEARYWLRPPGFAHPVDLEEVTSPDDIPETSYATRAKLTMGSPSDDGSWTALNPRLRVLGDRQHLLVSNTGPKRDGYSYCTKCGRIEATNTPTALLSAPHRKPFPDDQQPVCEGAGTARHIVLGTDFITDIALFSMSVAQPLQLKPGHYPTDVALRTISEALAKAGSQLLEIEPGELMAEYRPSLTPEGREGLKAEIFLYDTLPGGAGFSSQLVHLGTAVFDRALELMQTCPEGCDGSCYRCLRSFKNKFDHGLLDRHVGAELLKYLLDGHVPEFAPHRLRQSAELLFNDLRRQAGELALEWDAKRNGVVIPILARTRSGRAMAIALSAPLSVGHPADPGILEIAGEGRPIGLTIVNELLVRGNLPAATREVLQALAA
ncbi:MAG: DEAD/DEAH box helicase [Bauldia sp.]